MADDRDLEVAKSMLEDVTKEVDALKWVALSFEEVVGKEPLLSPDERADITVSAERILKDCEIIEKKIGSDQETLAQLNYIKGRAYAVYFPGKLFPIPLVKSHKKEAISCYEKAIELTSSNENKGMVSYYLARLYLVWGQKREAITNLEAAVNYLTVDDPLGMEAAKELERLKTEKKGMCFIATAVYGSPFADEVVILQEFRDNILTKSIPGALFVNGYYLFSPFIAQIITKSKILKEIVRMTIVSPLVKAVKYKYWNFNNSNTLRKN